MKFKLKSFTKLNLAVPVMIITTFVLILGMLLGIMYRNSIINQKQSNELLADRYSKTIELNLEGNINFLNLLATKLEEGNLPEAIFKDKVNSYLKSHPEFINITWVDSNFRIKSVCPLEGNAHLIGLDIELPMPKKASRLAREEKKAIYTEPFEAIQGMPSFEVWNPVFNKNKFMGLFAAVYSSNDVINTWIDRSKYSKVYFQLLDGDDEVVTDLPNSKLGANVISRQKMLTSLNNGMKLQVKSDVTSPFSLLIIVVILLLSFLILGIVYSLWKLKHVQVLLEKKEILLINQNIDLKLAKDKAEKSDQLKSAFLANMSHEIRTPMNGILGFASLLKEPDISGKLQQSYIEVIEKSGARMLNIIDDIVSISKIESGLVEVHSMQFSINELQEYLYTFFKPEVEKKKITFSFKSPLSFKQSIIKTDKDKFLSILANLIKNAIKYTDKGSIEFGYNLKGKFLEFYIKDTGLGIENDLQQVVFERFIQADIENKMARQGVGLGLSISKAFVEILGGKIWVESEIEIGSIFHFTIPYNPVSINIEDEKNNIPNGEIDNKMKWLNILVVEDDKFSSLLISTMFKKMNCNLLQAKNGLEAIDFCEKNPGIDLILMDIRMPEMDGYEATRQIRRFNTEVVIIAQTAFALLGDRERAIEAGCNEYITKPIAEKKLFALIQKTIK